MSATSAERAVGKMAGAVVLIGAGLVLPEVPAGAVTLTSAELNRSEIAGPGARCGDVGDESHVCAQDLVCEPAHAGDPQGAGGVCQYVLCANDADCHVGQTCQWVSACPELPPPLICFVIVRECRTAQPPSTP